MDKIKIKRKKERRQEIFFTFSNQDKTHDQSENVNKQKEISMKSDKMFIMLKISDHDKGKFNQKCPNN